MFDFSFAELATIGVVALVVIGPERLPKVARTVGHLMGRAQRYVNDVKADIQREVELEEFRKLKQGMDDAAGELRASLQETQNTIHTAGQTLQAQLDDAVAETKKRIVDPNAALTEQPALEAAAAGAAAADAAAADPAVAIAAPTAAAAAEAAAADASAAGAVAAGATVAQTAAPALAAPEAGAHEPASAEAATPAAVPAQIHAAQAELPLADLTPAVAVPPEPPAKPPVNATPGTPT